MNGSLLRVLISKRFFTVGVEVDAAYTGIDLSGNSLVQASGTFTVAAIRFIGKDEVAMEGASVRDGARKLFYARSITSIAGMDPIRFAASCGLDAEGVKIKEGKRRGRKPKNRILVEDEDQDDLVLVA